MKVAASARRSGQVLPLALAALVVLVAAALWLADVHHAIRVRDKTQDAGDAAALEAARFQGYTLNLAGEFNIARALAAAALAAGDLNATNSLEAIDEASRRLLFAGPLAGLAAAQQAAKLNGAPDNPDYADFIRDHAALVRGGYAAGTSSGGMNLQEPWPGAWSDYAAALESIASAGVAAGPDNAATYGAPVGGHVLLDPGFYSAVLGRDWCWFHRNAPDLPRAWRDFRSWAPLPDSDPDPPQNPEFLGVHLRADVAGGTNSFLRYDPRKWGEWTAMKDPEFPIVGTLRPESDWAGADVAMRVDNPLSRISGGSAGGDGVATWTGAAKPFGFVQEENGAKLAPPVASEYVLPAFREVGLVPLDAVVVSGGGSFDIAWRRHCTEHLPPYLERGPEALHRFAAPSVGRACRRCAALERWEDSDLRADAAGWLVTNSWRCALSPPGTSPGGGTRHAH